MADHNGVDPRMSERLQRENARIEKLEQELSEERALLDLLDREANAEPLLLHAGHPIQCHGFRGLGLGRTGRTLREALKQWRNAEAQRHG